MKRTTFVYTLLLAAPLAASQPLDCAEYKASLSARALAGKVLTGLSVSNVEFFQGPHPVSGSRVVITYDLESPAGDCEVSVLVSTDGGATFTYSPQALSGAVGPNVTPGLGLQIFWEISEDLPNTHIAEAVIRVIADDGECPGCKLWSDPDTWAPGSIPQAGDTVTIPPGEHLIMDVSPPPLAGLIVEGTVQFAETDIDLEAGYILVHGGTFRVGTESNPYIHQATITLTGAPGTSIMGMGTRGLMVMGGALELHGDAPSVPWTRIDADLPAGEAHITLAEAVDWQPGDQIVLAPTDFHTFTPMLGGPVSQHRGITETLTIDSASGTTISTTTGPQVRRWGVLQYATANGMSLTPPAPEEEIDIAPEMEGVPLVLDQRAEIGKLTRNIVIQSPDDTHWTTEGFGAHIMIMGGGSAHVDSVEIRRGGQRGNLGRYPFHWHMLSYDPPDFIGEATGQYFRNSVVNVSMNRGIVVHGTSGVLVENNIVYDVRGHGIFLEDAVEQHNTFDRNLVLRVRNPAPAHALKLHEVEGPGSGFNDVGSSGFWISNPLNKITNNVAADCAGFGYWLAFTQQAWGESITVPMRPQMVPLGEFDGNTAHTIRWAGIMLDIVEASNDGHLIGSQYFPTSAPNGVWPSTSIGYQNRIPFELTRYTVWKCGKFGIWDRASGPKNRMVVSADNCHKFFAGSGEEGLIERCLVIGNSLNNATNNNRPGHGGHPAPSGFATYHSTFDIPNNIIINFPLDPGHTSGAFAEDDFYFRPVEKGTARHSGNILINSHPGYKSIPVWSGQTANWQYPPDPHQFQPFASWFNFAPAKWDPHGWAGPAGNYIVYNSPFHTYNAVVTPITPDTGATPPSELGVAPGAVSVPGPFYGFTAFVLHGVGNNPPFNQDFEDYMTIHARRYDRDTLAYVGDWVVDGSTPPGNNRMLEHMRDFAAHHDGVYQLDFGWDQYNPGWGQAATYRHPTNLRMEVENMLTGDDALVIGIEFSGDVTASVTMVPVGNVFAGGDSSVTVPFQPVGDLDAVRHHPGLAYWQDTANNRVWVRLQGGHWVPNGTFAADSDQVLYQTMYLNIGP